MQRFHVSQTAAFLPLSLFTLGLALGPVMGAPISETLGRRAVYLGSFPPFFLFTMGAGLAQNFGTLLVCRFFAGAFCAPCLAVGAGSNGDLWQPLNRALSGSLFIMMPFFGPAIGKSVSNLHRSKADLYIRACSWWLCRGIKGMAMDTVANLDGRWRLLSLLPPSEGNIQEDHPPKAGQAS